MQHTDIHARISATIPDIKVGQYCPNMKCTKALRWYDSDFNYCSCSYMDIIELTTNGFHLWPKLECIYTFWRLRIRFESCRSQLSYWRFAWFVFYSKAPSPCTSDYGIIQIASMLSSSSDDSGNHNSSRKTAQLTLLDWVGHCYWK